MSETEVKGLRARVAEILRARGYERREEPFRLSSGALSHDYIDGKRALGNGKELRLAADAIVEMARQKDVGFAAVGGLTMGADPLAHAIAVVAGCDWFSVRKEQKGHGKQRLLEGAVLSPGTAVLVVDDVVTTGRSILQAVDAIEEAGARVVLATTLCDRGDSTARALATRGIPYEPLVTYRDLGIDPVSSIP